MEKISDPFIFQVDSPKVQTIYEDNDNYLIEYDDNQNKDYCAIYFSSNNIYYPNTETEFNQSIVEKNKYEWYGTRISYAHKHIFIRDIIKQWYLTGINANINSPDKLFEFLKSETEDYKIVTLGSSAGGYAAVLYGSLLDAALIFSFNGQFELHSWLKKSTEFTDPILFRFNKSEKLIKYFDIKPFVKNGSNIFYFYSIKSKMDSEQEIHIKGSNLNSIGFKTSHHGIPFLKCNLPIILEKNNRELNQLSGNKYHPFLFSLKMVGFLKTLSGLFSQITNKFKR